MFVLIIFSDFEIVSRVLVRSSFSFSSTILVFGKLHTNSRTFSLYAIRNFSLTQHGLSIPLYLPLFALSACLRLFHITISSRFRWQLSGWSAFPRRLWQHLLVLFPKIHPPRSYLPHQSIQSYLQEPSLLLLLTLQLPLFFSMTASWNWNFFSSLLSKLDHSKPAGHSRHFRIWVWGVGNRKEFVASGILWWYCRIRS